MTTPISDADLAKLQELAEKATPGPWHSGHLADDTHSCNCRSILSECYAGALFEAIADNGLPISEGGNGAPPFAARMASRLLQTLRQGYDLR